MLVLSKTDYLSTQKGFNLIEFGILHREVVSVQSLLASTSVEQLSHCGGNLRDAEISRCLVGAV